MTGLLESLSRARQAGLVLTRRDTELVIRGPRAYESLVRVLLNRKADVLALLPVYNGTATRLDWRQEPILSEPEPCVLCHWPALLIEPYDQRPCHKTCAEAALRWGTQSGARVDAGSAA